MVQHEVVLRVNWGDTDMAGIVYYPNYFNWFDVSTHALFNSIGLHPRELMETRKIGFPILDVQCSFSHPLYYNDEICVKSKVSEVRSKVFRVEHEVYRGEELTGKGYELRGWVYFQDDGTLKGGSIPEDARQALLGKVHVEHP